MCCPDRNLSPSQNVHAMAGCRPLPAQCGCGCLGSEPTASGLTRYREHLKAELIHVESCIEKLDADRS